MSDIPTHTTYSTHTGGPARTLTQRAPGEVSSACSGTAHGPRLAGSLSQNKCSPFTIELIGMHYSPVSPVRFNARSPRAEGIPSRRDASVPDHDHDRALSPPRRKSSLRNLDDRLGVDTSRVSLRGQYLEVAMEVAETVASLSHSCEPIPTDVPLCAAGLTTTAARKLECWLSERFDFRSTAAQLMEDIITAESLAIDILGRLSGHMARQCDF